jgi:hypothetical protein
MIETHPPLLVWRDTPTEKGRNVMINGEAAILFFQRRGIPPEAFEEMVNDYMEADWRFRMYHIAIAYDAAKGTHHADTFKATPYFA